MEWKWNRVFIITFLACSSVAGLAVDNTVHQEGCHSLPATLADEIRSYETIASRIIREIVEGKFAGVTYNRLAQMTDKFGPRMSGSRALEDAIDYIRAEMTADGLHSYTEQAAIPVWRRGFESAKLISPRMATLPILGLGNSVGTNGTTITADVIVVEDFAEFDQLPAANVSGKIVVFAQKFVNYRETVKYRERGASVAARKGARAALINSVTPVSLRTPHTGDQTYEAGVKQIPAACITLEDAALLLRLYRRGETLRIKLRMDDENLGQGRSRNLIGELMGREKVNESVVVLSGHLDSWDVGEGAMDDGGGAFIALMATTFLSQMGLRPRRTVRTILWTAEEQGLVGAIEYMKQHLADEEREFNFFMESDMGTFEPVGLDFSGNQAAKCIFNEVLRLLGPLNATATATPLAAGPDIELWTSRGFPGASLMNRNEKYLWYHHSPADSMLLEDAGHLDRATAAFAVAAYVIADMSVDMPKDVAAPSAEFIGQIVKRED